MPFTFSHPAIVLPLHFAGKKYFSVTALIVGSIVPDFEYFVRMKNYSLYSHTWKGLFWLDMPVAIFLCFLFHNIVRKPFIDNAPKMLYERFIPYRNFNWNRHVRKHLVVVVASVGIGVFSHLCWDRLTHRSFSLITLLPMFDDELYILKHPTLLYIVKHPTLVYRVVQTFYSVTGLAIIIHAIWQLPRYKGTIRKNNLVSYWLVTIGFTTSVYLLIILHDSYLTLQDYIGSAITAFLFSIIMSSLVVIAGKSYYISGER